MTTEVIVLNRKAKKQIEKYREAGWSIVDVTSKCGSDNIILSPFYPHGNIPIPGKTDLFADSVEGIWQGLKKFENGGTDYRKFYIRNMKNIKRSCRKYGHLLGHDYTDGTNELILDYCEARKRIYLPAYTWVLKNKLRVKLFNMLETYGDRIVLLDYTTNEDINDISTPLSHASIIKAFLKKYSGDVKFVNESWTQ
jgi:hypothetical protein